MQSQPGAIVSLCLFLLAFPYNVKPVLLNASVPGLSGPVVMNDCIPKLFHSGAH